MLYFSHDSTDLSQTFILHIYTTSSANFSEITDVVPQVQQFNFKVYFFR